MALWNRKGKDKGTGKRNGDFGNPIDEINYIVNNGHGAKRALNVAAREARNFAFETGMVDRVEEDGTIKLKSPEQLRFELSYQDFIQFRDEINRRRTVEQAQTQEPIRPKTDEADMFKLSPGHYSIRPPNINKQNEKAKSDEQIQRYENLNAKGYVGDVESLILPYILEKKEMGLILSESEEAILDKYEDNYALWDAQARAALILQIIGLIKDYTKEFPKTQLGIKMTLALDYGMYPFINNSPTEVLDELNREAASATTTERTHKVSPLTSAALDKLRGGQKTEGVMQKISHAGLRSGIAEEDYRGSEELQNKDGRSGGR